MNIDSTFLGEIVQPVPGYSDALRRFLSGKTVPLMRELFCL